MRDRGLPLAVVVGFPLGFGAGFCAAPILYLATYKDQLNNLWTMFATVVLLGVLIAALLAVASHLQVVRSSWRHRPIKARVLRPGFVAGRAS